jgi:7 transmembrane helices usually fused to an inactive transglutaminase/Inactive transglutaminase fused to 7 transmembrane helices
MYAKVKTLGIPLVPDQVSSIWSIEARVEFEGLGGSSLVNLDIPDKLGNFLKLDEFFVSRNYGLNVTSHKKDRRAEWSIRNAKGKQRLYYRIEVVPEEVNEDTSSKKHKIPAPPEKPEYEEPLASAIEDILGKVRSESANTFTFASQLLVQLNDPSPNKNVFVIQEGITPGTEQWVKRVIYVLHGARITARLIKGLSLEEGSTDAALISWLEIHNGQHWEGFDPLSGNRGYPPNFLRWSVGNNSVLNIEGGINEHLRFSLSERPYSMEEISQGRAEKKQSILNAWSLHKLPLTTQNVYQILLMIPLGALVVVLMRTFVGINCFGTFMSVLISLAFRETELLYGILLFCLITGAGLSFRFLLERLNLILVPRLSAVLVMVVMLMLGISLMSHELDIDHGISIALFPIVILTMVIERMSITWEESGSFEAIKEGIGSLVIAVIGYFVMTNDQLEYLMFSFPELLLLILAICIMAGRYTGYRLSEIIRFKDLANEEIKDVESNSKTS